MRRSLLGLMVVGPMALAGCRNDAVDVAIDARAIDTDGVLFSVAVFADDGSGCDGQRFVATPGLTLLSTVTIGSDADDARLVVPRLGDKLLVVDAVAANGSAIGRGCADVGVVDGVIAVDVSLLPTTTIAARQAGTAVVRDTSSVVEAIVSDATGAPVAGVAVDARAETADGTVLASALVDSDADGIVRFAPALPPLGPVRFRFTPDRPITDDATAVIAGFAAPAVEVLFAGAALIDPTPFVLDGDVAVVSTDPGEEGETLVLRRGTRGGPEDGAPHVLLPPSRSVQVLGAFEDEGTTGEASFLLAVVRPDTATPPQIVALAPRATGSVDAVIAAHPLDLDAASVRVVAVGDCRRGPQASPVLMVADDGAAFVDVAFGLVVVVPVAPAARAQLSSPLSSGCVTDDSGVLHRVVFGAVADAPVDLGPGLSRIGDAPTTAVRTLPTLDRVIQVAVRGDGVALFSRVDAGQVLVVPHRLGADAFVPLDAATEPAQLLPSAPLFVAQGPFFGAAVAGATDTLAILDLGTDVDPTASALFGVTLGLGTGVDGVCEPAAACSKSLTLDVDGDGRLALLTFGRAPGGRAIVLRLARFAGPAR